MNNFAKSFLLHGSLVALILMFSHAAHQVQKQSHVEHLVFMPANLPVPLVRPARVRETAVSATFSAPAARLAIGNPSSLSANPEPAREPRLVVMNLPGGSPDLPQASTPRVIMAPQAILGAFGSPVSAGSGSSHQAIAAGFGAAQGIQHNGTGHVQRTAFETTPAGPALAAVAQVSIQPPVIQFEGRPVFTAEAAQAHVEGTVVLQVLFAANGRVTVIGVTNGLPMGLTESAIRTAEGVRFTPAQRAGIPVDFRTTIRVTYQLAD